MNEYTDYLRQRRDKHYDILYSVCVNIQKKLIFYKPGRVAGTSIFRRQLQPMNGWIIKKSHDKEETELFNKWVAEITDAELKSYYTFIFVRNPFDRLVSVWNRLAKKQYPDFKTFVREGVFDENDNPLRPHYKKQSTLIETPDGVGPKLSFVGKFENIQSDWNKLCDILKIPQVKLGHYSKFEHEPYATYYDNVTIQLVQKMYARDLEIFDYEFEIK